jgi:hypothetical protein
MLAWFDHLRRDVVAGGRHLTKSPAFTTVAVLSLALGIMSTTAIYSVVHAVILDPFPYKDVDSLMSVRLGSRGRGGRNNYTIDQFLDIAERSTISTVIARRGATPGPARAIRSAFAATTAR